MFSDEELRELFEETVSALERCGASLNKIREENSRLEARVECLEAHLERMSYRLARVENASKVY